MQQRLNGYKKALAKRSIDFDPTLVVTVNRKNYENDIIDKLKELFEREQNMDAFFFSTHYLALEGLRYFYRNNIDITTQMRLGCFHDLPSLSILVPNMIIARQPVALIGKKAVKTLIQFINNENQTTIKNISPMEIEN